MPVNQLYKLDVIVLDPGGAGETVISQVENSTVSNELQEFIGRPAGHPFSRFRAIQSVDGRVSFTSSQLRTLLGAMTGQRGLCNQSAHLYFKLSGCAVADRTQAVHKRLVAQNSALYWDRVELPNFGKESSIANMSVTFQPLFDGTNPLYTVNDNVAIPHALTFEEAYGAGPLYVQNDTTGTPPVPLIGLVEGIQKVTIENNPSVQLHYAGSDPNPSALTIDDYNANVMVETLDGVNFTRIPQDGVCLDNTNGLVAFARRIEHCGTRYANTESQHIRFQAVSGLVKPEQISGSGNEPTIDSFSVGAIAASDTADELTVQVDQQIAAP